MNETNKVTLFTNLPLFTGFYHSVFCQFESWHDSEMEYLTTEEGMTEEEAEEKLWKCDTRPANIAVSEDLCDAFETLWNDNFNAQIKMTFDSLDSPREYNFSTDRISASIEFDGKELKELIEKHLDSITEHIAQTFKMRDGFMPHYSDDVKEWDLENLEDLDHNEINVILTALCKHEDLDDLDLYYESNISEVFMNNVEYPTEETA